MATTENLYTGDGVTVLYSFTFPYLDETDIKVSLDDVDTTAYTLANATTVEFNSAPTNGTAIRIYRQTADAQLATTFFPGSPIRAADVNANFDQVLYITQESTTTAGNAATDAANAVVAAVGATAAADSAAASAALAATDAATAASDAAAALVSANAAAADAATASTSATSAIAAADAANATAAGAVSTANAAATDAATAISTANSATTTANNAVTTANSAVTTANSAATVANTAANDASSAVSAAAAATATANSANATAATASANATTAINTANSATTVANAATTTANTAINTANNATTTANNASSTAITAADDAATALSLVASAVSYPPVADVASIPGSPIDGDLIEVGNSTGIESFTPLTGRPIGFVGEAGISVRLRYDNPPGTWTWVDYRVKDPDARYLVSGEIVNSDINASAAISDTKLATISTSGKVSNSATTATSNNTANAIVARNASGNFSAGTITANLTGTASAAPWSGITGKPTTVAGYGITDAVTTGSTGSVTSTMILDGTIVNADISGSAAIADTKLATISTAGKVSNSATTATSANTASAIIARDGSGNFNAGTANLTKVDLTGTYVSNIVAVGALNIDCSAGVYFTKTINGNSTFTVSNVPASRAFAFTLELTHTSGTVTWFSGVEWPEGVAPSLATGKTHLFTFVTDDGGTRWRGSSQVNYTN